VDIRDLHRQVGKVIGLAWRKLREIPWDKYGKGIKLVDDSGQQRYQGLMVMHEPISTDFVSVMMLGELADPGRSFQVVRTKLAILKDSSTRCSIELRNPPQVWGGAVRLHSGNGWGVTGLPEVADHIVITLTFYHLNMINFLEVEEFLQATSPGVAAACAYAGMDQESYKSLVRLLDGIISTAVRGRT
jgi:hypothetical protein